MAEGDIDIPFEVTFTHRVRFTDDCLGKDLDVLIALLDRAGDRHVRLLPIVEATPAQTALGKLEASRAILRERGVDLLTPLVLPGGEAIKNATDRLLPVLQAMMDSHLDRQSYVLAIGGGALLDAVGFAAALAHRGIRLVRLPTTTMGQGDSGVAVKNAINFFGKKNWLGTFAVPWAVINDRALLSTLPDRDWRAGFAEAVKVALLKEPSFFERLCADADAIKRRDWPASDHALRRSAHWHLMHITRGGDPFESREARPLDFGHWAAHRLEALSGFELRHGEAVAIGLAIDCTYSTLAHGLSPDAAARVMRCLRELGLPLDAATLAKHLGDADALLAGLEEFREHLGGRLTITMLREVGEPIDVHAVDDRLMRQAIETVRTSSVNVS